jgi:hypothetical protein
VGPRAGLDMVSKRKFPSPHRESNPDHPIVQPLTSRYTDWAIQTFMVNRYDKIKQVDLSFIWNSVHRGSKRTIMKFVWDPRRTVCYIKEVLCTRCVRKPNGFWNFKTSLLTMLRFHTDSHRAQCYSESSLHGNVSICANNFFRFVLKLYFISKTVRFSGASIHVNLIFAIYILLFQEHQDKAV